VPFDGIETRLAPFCTWRPLPARPDTATRTGKLEVEQLTCIHETGPLGTAPVPSVTVQTWVGLVGWVATVTA